MLTLRIALVAFLAVVVAACGSALAESDDLGSSGSGPDSTESTVTLPEIEDPPLPPALPEIEDPPLPTVPPEIEDPPLPTAPPTIEDPPLPTAPPTTAAADTTDVLVYFVVEPSSGIDGTDFGCGLTAAVTRRVRSPEVLKGAVEALLAGPSDAEAAAGYRTVLTNEVGWALASVTISDGTALIDFTEDSKPFNNMSASCVHLPLMAQLEATSTQFPTVDRAVFSVGGDVSTFYHWLERDVPEL